MANSFYNPSGNPATGARGLSSLVRAEFAAIGTAFDVMPRITTTGVFDTVFNQIGSYTFTLPSGPGTLATTANVATETTRATAAEGVLTTAVATEATTRAAAVTTETNRALAAEALKAPLASPALTGTPTAPTAAPGTNTTQLSTTAHSAAAVAVETAARTAADVLLAPKASPALTGTPTAPTAAPGTNTTQLATTAFDTAGILVETTRAIAAEAAISLVASQNVGRNLLHNGRFDIRQRGNGAWTTAGSVIYGADRWFHNSVHSNGSFSDTLQAFSDANRTLIGDESADRALNSVVVGGTAAGDFDLIGQHVEGVRNLAGKTVTLSFWAVNLGSAKVGIEATQFFGTGGSPSSAVFFIGRSSITLSTGFVRYSATFTMPSLSGKTLGTNGDDYSEVLIWLSAGSTFSASRASSIGVQSNTFTFWGIQLEVGSASTPLEDRPIGMELATCQRFYQVGQLAFSGGGGVAGATVYTSQSFPVQMRAAPTMATATNNCANVGSISYVTLAPGGMGTTLLGVVSASGNYTLNTNYTATADL